MVAAVELGGDPAVLRVVLVQVRVEQEEGHAADLREPHEHKDVAVADPNGRDDREAPVLRGSEMGSVSGSTAGFDSRCPSERASDCRKYPWR